MIKALDKAPPFEALDAALNAGKGVVLYFYPRDMTPGCTAEACSLRDGYSALMAAGYVVIGVSKDSEASHEKFRAAKSLPFELVSDVDHRIAEAYGVWAPKKFMGKEFLGMLRRTFVICSDGVVRNVFEKVDTKRHFEQIAEALELKNQ